ncbi:MAG: tetratricopeptide repeat protein [Thermodesulfovibrionales bacterium]
MKPPKLLVLSLLSAALLATACASTSSRQEKRESEFNYKMGLAYLSEGDRQKAFVHLQKALQEDPSNKDVINNLGLIYISLDNLEEAKELFQRAVSLDPAFSDAHNNLGTVYMRLGKWQEAIGSFREALANPLYQAPERAFYNLGTAYYRTGQFQPAIDAFKDALRRAPLFPLPYYGLALVYNKTERYGDAASVIAKAIELDSSYRGDSRKFAEDLGERLTTAKGIDETDLRDYLEILRY